MMSTVTADGRREQMLRWLEGDHPYEFLTVAAPYLDACPADHFVRLMAIREYLKLGLVVPARELLDVATSVGELPAEFASLQESLSALPGAAIPWARDAKRFEENLNALSGCGLDVTPIRRAWAVQASRYERFRDRSGGDQVRMREAFGRWRWIPRLGDHRAAAEAQPLPAEIESQMPGPFLFEGLDLGWYFHRVYEATRDTFLGYSCALFVVEPDPALLALVLHVHDWRDLLSDARVRWFWGDSWKRDLQRAWEDDPDLPWPTQGFRLSGFRPGCSPPAVQVVQEAAARRERAVKESLKALEARYERRDLRYWAERFDEALSGRGSPLRILAAVSTHTTFLQYSMRDAQRAFESLGHRCVVLTERTPYTNISLPTYHKAIREFDPDLFFSIDHLRPEFGGSLPEHLPVLTWDQDQLPHVFTKANVSRIGALDFVVGWSKIKCVKEGCNPRQFLYARIPTCPEQFSGEPLTDAERERYECDVSYVSHASQTPRAFHDQERAVYRDDGVRRLLDAMYELAPPLLEKHRVMWGALPTVILDEASRRCGLVIRDGELRDRLIGWYLWRLGDRFFRHEALEWVAAWARRTGRTFRLYGRGWDQHPTLSPFAAGPAENGRELLCIHRASKINLQLMPAGFIHQRALDGLVSGGFFLSRKTPHDLRGKILRRLLTRIRELGLTGTRALLDSTDHELRSLLAQYHGEWLHTVDRESDEFIRNLQFAGELLHPDEVFSRIRDILFDSAAEFAEAADRFLADDAARAALAAEMRDVALRHFSYRPTMDRFLRAMASYLREAGE